MSRSVSQPGISGGQTAGQQSRIVNNAIDPASPVGYYALQSVAPREDSLFLQRGVGSLDVNYRVRCSSWFCQTHLLGRTLVNPGDGNASRRSDRGGTFDEVIRAAERGNANAEFAVAEVLAGGHGVAANPRRAAFWYERAAAHGDTLAVARLNRLRATLAATN